MKKEIKELKEVMEELDEELKELQKPVRVEIWTGQEWEEMEVGDLLVLIMDYLGIEVENKGHVIIKKKKNEEKK